MFSFIYSVLQDRVALLAVLIFSFIKTASIAEFQSGIANSNFRCSHY